MRQFSFGHDAAPQPSYLEGFTQALGPEAAVLGMLAYLATVQDENSTLTHLSLESTLEGPVAYRWHRANMPDADGRYTITGQAINWADPTRTIGSYPGYASNGPDGFYGLAYPISRQLEMTYLLAQILRIPVHSEQKQ